MKSLFFQNFFDCCCVCFPIVTVLLNISPPLFLLEKFRSPCEGGGGPGSDGRRDGTGRWQQPANAQTSTFLLLLTLCLCLCCVYTASLFFPPFNRQNPLHNNPDDSAGMPGYTLPSKEAIERGRIKHIPLHRLKRKIKIRNFDCVVFAWNSSIIHPEGNVFFFSIFTVPSLMDNKLIITPTGIYLDHISSICLCYTL